MIWSDCYGRWDFYYYLGAYTCMETRRNFILHCICERREWEILKKTRTINFHQDIRFLKHFWKTVSSLDRTELWLHFSNHLTFKKVRVLSPLKEPASFDEQVARMRNGEFESLLPI